MDESTSIRNFNDESCNYHLLYRSHLCIRSELFYNMFLRIKRKSFAKIINRLNHICSGDVFSIAGTKSNFK
jgi:hypothetical protein